MLLVLREAICLKYLVQVGQTIVTFCNYVVILVNKTTGHCEVMFKRKHRRLGYGTIY